MDLDSFVRRVFKSNNLPSKFNLKLENTSYNQRSYSINIVPIVFHNSPSYLLVFNDTTIRNHNLYLQDSNRYKNQLLAYISHNLRTPLHSIYSFLKSLKTSASLNEDPNAPYNNLELNIARRRVQMLFELTTDIETFTEISKGDLLIITETFDIHTVVMEVVNEFEFTCQMKGIQLQWDLNKISNKMIHTDRERLKQILINLVSNSIQFTNRGFVRIVVQQEQDGVAKLIVEDTGEGMNDVQREYLMKRFKSSFRSA